jgi:hypothetical protein
LVAELLARLAQGLSPSQAAGQLAAESGWARREVYRLAMERKTK